MPLTISYRKTGLCHFVKRNETKPNEIKQKVEKQAQVISERPFSLNIKANYRNTSFAAAKLNSLFRKIVKRRENSILRNTLF